MDGGVRYAHPVFAVVRADGRHFRWLAERIGYSHSHVRNVACGQFPATPRFRRECARVMGLPEEVLFHDDGSQTSQSVVPDGSESDRAVNVVARAEGYPTAQEVAIGRMA